MNEGCYPHCGASSRWLELELEPEQKPVFQDAHNLRFHVLRGKNRVLQKVHECVAGVLN